MVCQSPASILIASHKIQLCFAKIHAARHAQLTVPRRRTERERERERDDIIMIIIIIIRVTSTFCVYGVKTPSTHTGHLCCRRTNTSFIIHCTIIAISYIICADRALCSTILSAGHCISNLYWHRLSRLFVLRATEPHWNK